MSDVAEFNQARALVDREIEHGKIRGGIVRLIDDYGDTTGGSALLQKVDATKAALVVQREPNTTSRITARVELYPVDVADQFGFVLDQVG